MTGGFVSNNTATGTGPGGGGGIYSEGTLTLSKVVVKNNMVEDSFGAGINVAGAVATINNSVIRHNNGGFGGGLSVAGGAGVRFNSSLIQENTGFGGGGASRPAGRSTRSRPPSAATSQRDPAAPSGTRGGS